MGAQFAPGVMAHKKATVGNSVIGLQSVLGPEAVIGNECQIEGATIEGYLGDGVKVWRGAHVMANSTVGDGTIIGARTEIGDGVVIGKNCKIEAHVFIPRGVVIQDEVFIGPGTVFTNDRYPKATGDWKCESTLIRNGASIGAGCVVLPGIIVGVGAMIGAGTIVTKDVNEGEVMHLKVQETVTR